MKYILHTKKKHLVVSGDIVCCWVNKPNSMPPAQLEQNEKLFNSIQVKVNLNQF